MNPYLLQSLPAGPVVLRRLIELIPEARYDQPLDPERFTIREVVAHLADWEVLFRARMELALAHPGSRITAYDEGERAVELMYSETDIWERLELFRDERAKTKAFLDALTLEQFRIPYIHPALGQMVIEDQANMLVEHDMYHVLQLTDYLTS